MKYYTLRQSSDVKVTGVADGSAQCVLDRNGFNNVAKYEEFMNFTLHDDPEIYWRNLGRLPVRDFDLECLRLQPGAWLTDFLSYAPSAGAGGNFLISEKVQGLLHKLRLPPYKLYRATIYSNGNAIRGYRLLYCPPLDYNVIDFSRTTFFTGNRLRGKKQFSLKDGREFQQLKNDSIFQTDSIGIDRSVDLNFDYFLTKVSIPTIFISDSAREIMLEANLTGVNVVDSIEPSLVI